MSAGSPEPPGVDDLRRRLYGPGASAEDVAGYEAATGTREADRAALLRPDPPRRRSRIALAVAVVGVGVALTVGVLAERASTTRTEPSSSPSTVVVTPLVAPAAARTAFEEALAGGGDAGLLEYLYRHPGLRPPAILTVGRADSTEYSGEGTTTLSLSPSALAERGGRMTVIVVLARSGRYAWRSVRVAGTGPGFAAGSAVTGSGGAAQAGAPVAGTFSYGRGAPSRLTVVVDDAVRWGAVVVFTD